MPETPAGTQEPGIFRDVAREVGLDFVHDNGMTGELLLPEITGAGGAFVDFDNDGDLDVYLVQGTLLTSAAEEPRSRHQGLRGDRLFRNDLRRTPGAERAAPEDATLASGALRFRDATGASGIDAPGYGMGIATADFDNDGFVDLYVTNYGANQLFRNNGDGTFEEIGGAAGVDDDLWGTSASFLDFDGDGWLDLYVANYVEFDVEDNPRCYAPSSRRDYCGPDAFESQPDRLYRNRGDGGFTEVASTALEGDVTGPGLGVVVADFNGDALIDIYVANDGRPNRLWVNLGGGRFVDDALLAGVAVNRDGLSEASMGVDAGDFDRDGDEDLFMTHLMSETNTLYVNLVDGMFEDRTIEYGLASESLPYTAFGTGWFDYDGDGWLDLLVLNGAVRILEALARAGDPYPLRQPNQLFRGLAGEGFEEVAAGAGPAFDHAEVSRGAAFGDVDNDGDQDVLVANNNGPARLLLNEFPDQGTWVGLRLASRGANRFLYGARVEVVPAGGGPSWWARVGSDGSYCSASDPRLLVGIGEADGVSTVRVHLGDGVVREWQDVPTGGYVVLGASSTPGREGS